MERRGRKRVSGIKKGGKSDREGKSEGQRVRGRMQGKKEEESEKRE